ncbi:MAG: hypothetical protein HUU37_05890 [Bdellovibrionales bacterium]|nr:hypothetical protein [Bdellovibrionales bacterium]
MLEQIYAEPPRGDGRAAAWVNVLEQGADIQGVYHGMILSTEYAARKKPGATDQAVGFFSEEMALFRAGKWDWDPALSDMAAEIRVRTKGAAIYLLKREMGRAVLERVSQLAQRPEALAQFYAHTAIRLSKRGVNFGLSQRNSGDFEFHRDWALSNPRGMIEWELLNRYHRCLNRFGGLTPAGR